ncbi:hypothetical protein WH158_13485 [Gluconobacter cerinus]|uniref:hypothetical protein n=1 Tax=Gluconobacter cerinus TaxID=38307 RepID=UPI0030A7E1A1
MAAPLLLDLVLETSTTPGTASFVLNGAVQDRRSFAAAAPGGGQVFYFADDGTQAEWGVGVLTVGTPNTLSRQTIRGTTQNSTSALNFTGTVRVYSWVPSSYLPLLDGNGLLTVAGLSTDGAAIKALVVSDSALVPNVSDWGSQQSVPAVQADTRYLRKYGDSAAVAPDLLTIYLGNGQLGAYAGGSWHTFQPAGDYATNARVNDVASSADNAASSASANAETRILRAGDTSQNQTVNGYLTVQYGGGKFSFQPDGNAVAYDGSGNAFFSVSSGTINWNGHGFVFTDDLPLPKTDKIVRMIVRGVASQSRVTFSSGFSDTPQVMAQNASASDANCKAVNADAGGFTLWINGGGTTDITVFAIGPK